MKLVALIVGAVFTLSSATMPSGGGKKEKAKFIVYGNCGMCETTIENALKDVEGIAWADWDLETLELEVKFDPEIISLDEIKQHVADAGYDSDSHRATEESYNELHACCKYERP